MIAYLAACRILLRIDFSWQLFLQTLNSSQKCIGNQRGQMTIRRDSRIFKGYIKVRETAAFKICRLTIKSV